MKKDWGWACCECSHYATYEYLRDGNQRKIQQVAETAARLHALKFDHKVVFGEVITKDIKKY